MSWAILLFLVVLALYPFVREWRKPPMDDAQRTSAPGDFATLSQGITHYRWTGPLRGPVAVCVHGLTTPSFVWSGLARGLAAMGYRVLVYDLYGRGYSDRPAGVQDRAFFVTQLEDLLEDQNVLEDFTLLGYSMGGSIATAFSALHPNRIRQLYLIASAGLPTTPPDRSRKFVQTVPVLGRWLMYLMFPRRHRQSARADRTVTGSVPGIADLQIRELETKGFVPAVLASLRGILAEDFSEDHRTIHRAGIPVLAIWAREDSVIPLSAMGRLTEVSRSARQEVIDGADHGLPYTHSEQVLNALRETVRDG